MSLSTFMADAALSALHRPDRKRASEGIARLRKRLAGRVTAEEIADWRREGPS